MDIRAQEIFKKSQDHLLQEAVGRYGADVSILKRLGSFESVVYEYERDGRAYILRITDSTHRTVALIRGELDWVNYLADHGVSVPRAVESNEGNLVEIVHPAESSETTDIFFSVVSFVKASGRLSKVMDWSDDLLRKWGAVTGRMHALSRGYHPLEESWRRPHWDEDVEEKVGLPFPASEARVMVKFQEQIARLRALPTESEAYGLTHVDLHHGNFFIQDGEITVFDFDDSQYDWYVNDIAMPLFYAIQEPDAKDDPPGFARWFLQGFLDGYFRENDLDRRWLMHIPDFMKLREIDLYISILRAGGEEDNRWMQRYLQGRKARIENDVPVVDLDFGGWGAPPGTKIPAGDYNE